MRVGPTEKQNVAIASIGRAVERNKLNSIVMINYFPSPRCKWLGVDRINHHAPEARFATRGEAGPNQSAVDINFWFREELGIGGWVG